jgi:hypothetical protein
MIAPVFKFPVLLLATALAVASVQAQERAPPRADAAEINLRKEVGVREYQGRQISGEERQIGRGDSLWRILVEEKGVPERRFRGYLVVIRGLNPQIKNLDILRAGDKVFIPIRLGDVEEARPRTEAASVDAIPAGSGRTVNYRVKAGESLYRILREQFKLSEERRVAQYASLVKDLNPQRKGDWDTLREGEIIRLPAIDRIDSAQKDSGKGQPLPGSSQGLGSAVVEALPTKPSVPSSSASLVEQAMRSAARENMDLFVKVVQATGNEVQLSGEEVVSLPDGNVRFDKNTFPVVVNSMLRQRVVIDPDGKIPASIKAKLNDPRIGTPVVPMANGLSIAEAVRQLLISIGYQPLPADRPVVVQEAGITFEAKGHWMALAPAVSNKPQEVIVVNLTDRANEIPEYLTAELMKRGVHLRDVVLPETRHSIVPIAAKSQLRNAGPVKELPRDKRELVDALLLSFQIPFEVGENTSVELRDGLRIETRIDRLFELDGKRTAVFFRRIDPVTRQALQEKHNTRSFDLEIDSLSSRDVIFQILRLLGDRAAYSEHRFSATKGSTPDRLTLKAWGFNVKKKPMFVTDRQISPALQRFFFEKGLDIVYFQ